MREFAVAQDGGGAKLLDVDLLQDFAGGGQWLDEDGLLIGDGGGNEVEIFERQRQIFGEGAVVIHDANDGAACAMRFEAAAAEGAFRAKVVCGAGDVDFAGDALAEPFGFLFGGSAV